MPADLVKSLQKHARKYGSDGVMEHAIELKLSFQSLVLLQKTCDEADDRRTPKILRKKRRLSVETRVKRLLGIEEDSQEGTP
jgi:hypothetical protein